MTADLRQAEIERNQDIREHYYKMYPCVLDRLARERADNAVQAIAEARKESTMLLYKCIDSDEIFGTIDRNIVRKIADYTHVKIIMNTKYRLLIED